MEYKVFAHLIKLEQESIKTYGIVLFVNGSEVLRVKDVSTDYNALIKFVDSLNKRRIDPFCLGEHIEFFINGN